MQKKKDNLDYLFLKLKKRNIMPEQFANDYCLVSALMKSVEENYSGTNRFIERIQIILDINSTPSTHKLSNLYKEMTSEKTEKSERNKRLKEWATLRLASFKLRNEKLSSFIQTDEKDLQTKKMAKYSTTYKKMNLSSENRAYNIYEIIDKALEVQEHLNEKDDSKVIEYIKDLSKLYGYLSESDTCRAFCLLKSLSADSVKDIFDITKYATDVIKSTDEMAFPEFILELYVASENNCEISKKILREMYNLHGEMLDRAAIKEFQKNSGAKIDEILSKFTQHFKEKYELKKEYRHRLFNFIQKLACRCDINDRHKDNFVLNIIEQCDRRRVSGLHLLKCLDQCARKKMSSERFETYLNVISLMHELEDSSFFTNTILHTKNVFSMAYSLIKEPFTYSQFRFRILSLLFFVEKSGDISKQKDFYDILKKVNLDLVKSGLDEEYYETPNEFIELMKNLTSCVISPLNTSFFSEVGRVMLNLCMFYKANGRSYMYDTGYTREDLCNFSSLVQYANALGKKSESYRKLLALVIKTVGKNDGNLEKAKEELRRLYDANKNKIEYVTDLIKYI